MKTLGTLAVLGILSTPALAFDPPTPKPLPDVEERYAIEADCARLAWENTRTFKYGMSFPVDVAKAEEDLAYIQVVTSRLPDDAPERDVHYFLIPSECDGGMD